MGESVEAAEQEVLLMRKQFEQRQLHGYSIHPAASGVRDLPTLMGSNPLQDVTNPLMLPAPASLPTHAASQPVSERTSTSPLTEPPSRSYSARGPPSRQRKLASALSSHVQDLEK